MDCAAFAFLVVGGGLGRGMPVGRVGEIGLFCEREVGDRIC